MGDRIVVVFASQIAGGGRQTYSPGIYLHGDSRKLPGWLGEAAETLRKGDPGYSAARFCAFCCGKIPGNLGIGLVDPPQAQDMADGFRNYSPGNGGVAVVDVDTGDVEFFAGYFAEEFPEGFRIELPGDRFR